MTTSLRMLRSVSCSAGCCRALATAQSVTYDFRPTQDFSRLRTYTFRGRSKDRQPVR